MKKYLFIMLATLLCSYVQAQTINGKILDNETKEPIVGATIQSISGSSATVTNSEGKFSILLKSKDEQLKITSVGYQTQIVEGKPDIVVALGQNTQQAQTVVVTANRVAELRANSPVAISKLSPKLIDETKATMIYELINKTPGVIMPSYNNEQHGMSIRQPMGTAAYYLYMEDGVPIRPLGIFNHNALLEVNQFSISNVEVVKGPVSSIYGPEAVGGAINFIMQRPTSVPTAKLGFQFDNWGFKRTQFGAGAKMKKFGFYIGGLSSDQEGSWLINSDYHKTSINARFEYNFTNKTRLIGNTIFGNFFSQMSGSVDSAMFYSGKFTSSTDFTYRKNNASRSRLTFEHDWNNGSKSFITLFHRDNVLEMVPSFAIRWSPTQSPTNDPNRARGEKNSNGFKSLGVIAQHTQKFNFLKSKLILGTVFDNTENDYWSYRIDLFAQLDPTRRFVTRYTIDRERPDIPISNYHGHIKNMAGYAQLDFEPLKKLKVSVGGRYDLMSLDYINNINSTTGNILYKRLTPKMGATYDLGKGNGIYVNVSQGFSPPNLTAIFRPKPNTNPVQFYTNLNPAYFNNYEFGGWVSLVKNKINLDLTFYQMDGRNELLNIRQPDNSFDFQSAGKTLHKGIEFGASARPSKEVWFRLGGTTALHKFIDFEISKNAADRYKNLAGFEMPSSPRWTWNGEISYYPAWLPNFRTSVEIQRVSGWFQNQINTVRYHGYALLNYRVGYKWKGIEVYSNITNLTNEFFANSVTRGNNPTDRSSFNPGAPRVFTFGIQYNFVGKK